MISSIGFIGLGAMGRPMATNLLNAGFTLTVHNRSRGPVEAMVAAGALAAASPEEAAAAAQVVITCLPDAPDVGQVLLGPSGAVEGARPGTVFVDMSTIAPPAAIEVAQTLQARGFRCLDAPVSGGDVGAQQGTLTIMVGGDRTTLEEVMPVFNAMGKSIVLCGPHGAGQTVKACNQIQTAMNMIGMAEALVLGAAGGVDPAIIVQVLSGGYAQTRIMDVRGPRVLQRAFEPGFKGKLHLKDLNIVRDTARALGASLPASAVANEIFAAMVANGWGELDHSGVIRVIESLSNVTVRSQGEPAS